MGPAQTQQEENKYVLAYIGLTSDLEYVKADRQLIDKVPNMTHTYHVDIQRAIGGITG